MTRPRSNAVTSRVEGGAPLLDRPHVWCPGLDMELNDRAQAIIRGKGLHPQLLLGGRGQLGEFAPTAKLYILAHGHAQMPLFKTSGGQWTASQLAVMLHADGLPTDQRDIELLVCHAGESVNTRANAAKLMDLQREFSQAKASGQQRTMDKLTRRYEATYRSGGQSPTFFETSPETLLLPMAAQLTQELKTLGHTHFRMISYKCPVAQYNPDHRVYLDLSSKGGPWGVPADDHPEYQAIWH